MKKIFSTELKVQTESNLFQLSAEKKRLKFLKEASRGGGGVGMAPALKF